MKGRIVAEIFGGRVKPLLSLGLQTSGKLKLTTSDDLQQAGRIRLLLQRGGEAFLLEDLIVERIPPAEAGHPDIDLELTTVGRAALQARILVNGRIHKSTRIDLRKVGARHGWGLPVFAAALVVLAMAAFIWFGGLAAKTGTTAPGRADSGSEKPDSVAQAKAAVDSTDGKGEAPTTAERKQAEQRQAGGSDRRGAVESTGGNGEKPRRSVGTGRQEKAATASSEPAASAVPKPGTRRLATVYFFPEDHLLGRDAQEPLNRILPVLRENPEWKVTLAGHCALYDDEASRERLSLMRADSVYVYLRDRGWRPASEPERIGYGGKRPVTRDRQNQYLNRRVEILY